MKNTSFNPKGIIKSEDNRFRYIDILYVIGIILVVWGHSHPLNDSWFGTWYSDLNALIYTFHMPLFFFIGGYLMVFSKSVEKQGYFKWALGKLLKFLIPYLVLTAIAFFPKGMLGDTSDNVELSFEYFFRTTFLIPRNGVWGHFWFIPTFLTLDLVWGAWRSFVHKGKAIYISVLAVLTAVSIYLAVCPIPTDYFVLYDISQVALFYAIGILTALIKPVLWDRQWKNWCWIVICTVSAYFLYPYGNFRIRTVPIINFLVGMMIVWACWNLAKSLTSIKSSKICKKITQYNFSIYIYSWPAQAVLDTILRRMGVNWIAIIFILFVSGFIFPLLIVTIYKKLKFLHCKFFDYLIGIQTV